MAVTTSIEWTDATFNAWIGCTKISPACDNCYAELNMAAKFLKVKWGAGEPRHRTSVATWENPIKWNNEIQKDFEEYEKFQAEWEFTDGSMERLGFIEPSRKKVFCNSLSDVFDNEVPQQWRNDLWALIEATPYLDWQLVTKRIGNARTILPPHWIKNGLPHNVWLIISVCNQEECDRDVPKLLEFNCAVRGLSIEPLLAPIDLRLRFLEDGINWVIVGGESGKNARPMSPDWVRSIRDQCVAAGVALFFKQWGEWLHIDLISMDFVCDSKNKTAMIGNDCFYKVGKKRAGNVLDGQVWEQFPLDKT
jgi:protein gp37